MNLLPYAKPHQFFELENGKATRFFTHVEDNNGVLLISDGDVSRYNLDGTAFGKGRKARPRVTKILPPVVWNVNLSALKGGETVLFRNYELGVYTGSVLPPDGRPAYYLVEPNNGGSTQTHSKEGWCWRAPANSDDHDVIAYFEPASNRPTDIDAQIHGMRSLLYRLEKAQDLDEQKKELHRLSVGLTALLETITKTVNSS